MRCPVCSSNLDEKWDDDILIAHLLNHPKKDLAIVLAEATRIIARSTEREC